MDSLYEHVHEDADPIQGSAGVTNSFSRLTEAREEEIASYEEHRTRNDVSRRTNRTLDPLEHLPPELSTFIITQALTSQDNKILPSMYPSRLIELTTVSKKWQSFLFSTPVLWSELYINERHEDFLATLSVFIRLSSDAPLKLFLCGEPTGIDWTALASILLPAAERVTCLNFVIYSEDDFGWVPNALSTLLERLCHLPRLEEVNFPTIGGKEVSLLRIKSFGLPSTVKFNCLIKLLESYWGSGTSGRFFDVTKCKSLGTLEQLLPRSRPNLQFKYHGYLHNVIIISNGTTLSQPESLAERLVECNCFEQVVHTVTFTLHYLRVDVNLSQAEDLLDCLQMFMHLEVLAMDIRWGDRKITRDHTLIDTTSRNLKRLELILHSGVENLVEARKPLGDLFSVLGTLYPGVEDIHIHGSAFIDLEISYIQDLQALKSLVLVFAGSPLALPSGSITLQSVQCLEMRGVARLDNLRTPNLLKLVLELGHDLIKFDHLGPFPRGLRSLAITFNINVEDFHLTSLDFPDLRDLYLGGGAPRAAWGRLSLQNLVSITFEPIFRSFTDSLSNQLCITLLCYPWLLPSLRQLHFINCVEWDVLFLMLKSRNCDKSGVQRIDTVTLPFIPFAFHNLLARLLAGEIVELPSLIYLSLEATREVLFDSSVPGCFACLTNMRPGCTVRGLPDGRRVVLPADRFYPIEDHVPEETSQEIQDWLSQRRELVEIWKASYEEFAEEHSRVNVCRKW